MCYGYFHLLVVNVNGVSCYVSTTKKADQSKAANYPIKHAYLPKHGSPLWV